MDKMMICPKAKECKECENLPIVKYHTEPHSHNNDCDGDGDICPACIPYKPESTIEQEIDKNPITANYLADRVIQEIPNTIPLKDFIKSNKSKPSGQLVILPKERKQQYRTISF